MRSVVPLAINDLYYLAGYFDHYYYSEDGMFLKPYCYYIGQGEKNTKM